MFEQSTKPELLQLIKIFSLNERINQDFYLAGGTALALQIGHRLSVDIDLFTQKEFDVDELKNELLTFDFTLIEDNKNTLHVSINGIKVSFLYYPFSLISDCKNLYSLNISSLLDIFCMKLLAITHRAEKKDYFDLYELFNLVQPLDVKIKMIEKYGENKINFYAISKSLIYFEDAEFSKDPILLNNTKWDDVKKYFLQNEKKISSVFLK